MRVRTSVLLGVLLLVAGTVVFGSLAIAHEQAVAGRDAQIADMARQVASLEAAHRARALDAQRADDLRALIAQQEAGLASTDGFLQ